MNIIDRLFRMDGRTVVVNGGGGRIGSVVAKAIANAGANVVILDIDPNSAGVVRDELRRENANALAIQCDSTERGSLEAALLECTEKVGVPSGLVNATQFRGSGFYGSDPSDHPVDAWDRVIRVNLTGVFLACQVFGKAMFKINGGSIVNISSTYGVVSPDPRIYGESGVNSPVSYAASKSAILNLSRYLAIHWRDWNIRVNTLIPGGVYDGQTDDFVSNYSARTPLGRMAEACDYEGAVLFMLSNASSYMTGATVTVDGGWTAW